MPNSSPLVPALLPGAGAAHVAAVLGAMRAVAETGGAASDADRAAVEGCARFIFGGEGPGTWDAVAPVAAPALAAVLRGKGLAEDALKFLTVMALVDGRLDTGKIAAVLGYARALGLDARYVDEITEAAQGRVQAAMADMTRANMESVTGRPWTGLDAAAWLTPYGAHPDPALAARFEALRDLPEASFGQAYWRHFTANGYAFPGRPGALNAAFAIPHDSAHVLTGYGTTPRGELLVSTFTAAMHRVNPMSGHILPVIFSWHLKLQINAVAKDAAGALDPPAFWKAWAAGAAARVDTFAAGWDFWGSVGTPLVALRERWAIPAPGLDPPGASGSA
jgi:hypothetical protein